MSRRAIVISSWVRVTGPRRPQLNPRPLSPQSHTCRGTNRTTCSRSVCSFDPRYAGGTPKPAGTCSPMSSFDPRYAGGTTPLVITPLASSLRSPLRGRHDIAKAYHVAVCLRSPLRGRHKGHDPCDQTLVLRSPLRGRHDRRVLEGREPGPSIAA